MIFSFFMLANIKNRKKSFVHLFFEFLTEFMLFELTVSSYDMRPGQLRNTVFLTNLDR